MLPFRVRPGSGLQGGWAHRSGFWASALRPHLAGADGPCQVSPAEPGSPHCFIHTHQRPPARPLLGLEAQQGLWPVVPGAHGLTVPLSPTVRVQLPHGAECRSQAPAQPHPVPAGAAVLSRTGRRRASRDTTDPVPPSLPGGPETLGSHEVTSWPQLACCDTWPPGASPTTATNLCAVATGAADRTGDHQLLEEAFPARAHNSPGQVLRPPSDASQPAPPPPDCPGAPPARSGASAFPPGPPWVCPIRHA